MKRVKSKSDKRLIIEAEVNGKVAHLLIDTGAAVGIFDDAQGKKYGLKYGSRYHGTLQGVGGDMGDVYVCSTFAQFENKVIPQFLVADISSVVRAVRKETGIEILGIVGLPQMRIAGIGVDANDMEIIVE